MNLGQHPDLLDQLAARHAVGLLNPRVRRRLEAQARQSAAIRAQLLLWQERIGAMTELPAGHAQVPSANVWKRIENALHSIQHSAQQRLPTAGLAQAQAAVQATLDRLQRSLSWWRGGAALAGVAALSLVVLTLQQASSLDDSRSQVAQLDQQLKAQSATHQVQYVAVLADAQASATVLVTFDPSKQRMVLQRVGSYQEASDKSLQLWALPQGGAPQSLGVMSANKVLRLSTPAEQIRNVPTLAVSLEPKGGVPSAGGPTGPVLFKGALLQTVL